MVWNDQLEAVAMNYGDNCVFEHSDTRHQDFLDCTDDDGAAQCVIPSYPYCVGENLAQAGTYSECTGVTKESMACSGDDCDTTGDVCTMQNMFYGESASWVQAEGTALDCWANSHCSQVVWQSSDQ